MEEILDAEHLAKLIETGDREVAKKYIIDMVTKEAESSEKAALKLAKAVAYIESLNTLNQNYLDVLREVEGSLTNISRNEQAELDQVDLEETQQKIAEL